MPFSSDSLLLPYDWALRVRYAAVIQSWHIYYIILSWHCICSGLGWFQGATNWGQTICACHFCDYHAVSKVLEDHCMMILQSMSPVEGNHLEETYFSFKEYSNRFEPYISQVKNHHLRKIIAQFRIGSQWLPVCRGRQQGIECMSLITLFTRRVMMQIMIQKDMGELCRSSAERTYDSNPKDLMAPSMQ